VDPASREGKPTFGDRDFRSIKRAEINALHASLKDTPAAANSVLGTISSLFTWIYKDSRSRTCATRPSASSASR
jgi:hypothetical protein